MMASFFGPNDHNNNARLMSGLRELNLNKNVQFFSMFARTGLKRRPRGWIFKKKTNQDFTPLNNSKDTERGGVLLYERHFNCCDDVM